MAVERTSLALQWRLNWRQQWTDGRRLGRRLRALRGRDGGCRVLPGVPLRRIVRQEEVVLVALAGISALCVEIAISRAL